mgnify:CR=1 FL=1
MRRLKKAIVLILLVFILCPCVSMVADAAEAGLHFTDPSTTVGAEVEVTANFSSTSTSLQSLNAVLTYDAGMLRFVGGDSASGGNGTVTIDGTGGGSSIDFVLKFQALQEGTANIEVSQASGTDATGAQLDDITYGSSAVTIGPGDPSLIVPEGTEGGTAALSADGPVVEVEGVQYQITNGFPDTVIPSGFVKSEMTYEGQTCQVVTQEAANGLSAMLLTPVAGGDPEFFLYSTDDGTFTPFEQVEIAADRYIVLLRDDGTVKLPESFQETRLTLNDKSYTAWQNADNPEYYVVYALSADGQKTLYQYDTLDGTYQRYVQQAASSEPEKKAAKGVWGKILRFIENMLDIVVIVVGLLILVLIIVLIVIGVKLYHRNLELDDLYDEYGIDLDDDDDEIPETPRSQKTQKAQKTQKTQSSSGGKKKIPAKRGESKPAVRVPVKTMNLREEFDDFDEDDDYDDSDDYYDDDDYDYDSEDSSEMIDDLDELLSKQPKKKRGHMEKDDAFQVDFIDLDE